MARRPRVIIPGAAHHVTQRGNNRSDVFFSGANCRYYLDLLTDHAKCMGVGILGYCLMPNHVHLVAVPEREDSLSRLLRRLHSAYAVAVNRAGDRSGHLWQCRFYSCPLDERHLMNALRYTDLNPVRAGLAAKAWEWAWSSAKAHTDAGSWDRVLDAGWAQYCGPWNYGEWQEMLTAGLSEGESEAVRQATRSGAPLGSRDFVERLERRTGRRLRVLARGRPAGKKVSDPIFGAL